MSKSTSGTLTSQPPSVIRFEVDVPSLFVKRLVLGSDDELSMAVFGVHPQDRNHRDLRIEDVWTVAKKGQRVKVTSQMGNSRKQTLFHGWITEAQIRAGGKMEDVEFTAMGLDWGLKVEKIFGAWCPDKDAKIANWLRATQPCFNKDGRPNKFTSDVQDSQGNQRVVFALDDDVRNPKNAFWNAAHMVRYCVSCERKGDLSSIEGRIFATTYQPGGEIADFRPLEVNPEGEDIWTAICKIGALTCHGVKIKYAEDRTKPTLEFFSKKIDEAKDTKQFEIPEATLTAVSIEDYGKILDSLDVQIDLSGIVRRVDAVTPTKLFDDEYELHAGWKKEDEDDAFGDGTTAEKISNFLKETDPEKSSDWERFKYVGRRFILNETGRDDECDTVGEATGDPYDFGKHFGDEAWTVHNRPFRHTLAERDASGANKPAIVHVDMDDPFTLDVKLGQNVELLSDRAGVYFRGQPIVLPASGLEIDDPAYIFPLRVYVEACVEGDQDSPHDVNGILGGDEMPVPTFGLVRLADGLREDNANGDTGAAEKAQKLCDEAVSEMKNARLVGTATIPWISFQFSAGDVIDKINGRGLAIKAQIAKVTWDAIDQSTEISLHYPGIDTHTHARSRQRRPEEHWTRATTSKAFRNLSSGLDLAAALGVSVPSSKWAQIAEMPAGAGENEIERVVKDALHEQNFPSDIGGFREQNAGLPFDQGNPIRDAKEAARAKRIAERFRRRFRPR